MAIENQNSPVVNDEEKSYLSKVKVGDKTYHLKDAEVREAITDIEYTDTASGTFTYTPAGTISNTTISVTPTTATVQEMKTAGTAYTMTDGEIDQAPSSNAQFPIEGMIATYDESGEGLVLTVSSKTAAITQVGTVTYTPPTLSGALPTFGPSANVVTGVSAEFAVAPVFTGTAATITISVTPDVAAE